MKITRIDRVNDARVFRDFTWPTGDSMPDFGRFNLIYGWNGSGKTTLSELLRHFQTREPVDPSEGEIQLRVDDRPIRGESLATAALPPVRVFNRNSVDRGVFEAAGGKLPPVYFLGEESVEKQQQIDALTKDLDGADEDLEARQRGRVAAQADFEAFCTDRARQVKLLLTVPGGGPYNNYDARSFKATAARLAAMDPRAEPLDDAEKSRDLAAKEGTARDKLGAPLKWPSIADLLSKVERLLTRTVQSDAIAALVEDPEVGTWVADGLALHTGDRATQTCRFCGQPLPPARLGRLQAHFNDQFRALQLDISGLVNTLDLAGDDIASTRQAVPDGRLVYANLAAEYATAAALFDRQATLAAELTAGLRDALETKAREPFRELRVLELLPSPSKREAEAPSLVSVVRDIDAKRLTTEAAFGTEALDALARLIDQHNSQTEKFRTAQDAARAALEADIVLGEFAVYEQKLSGIDSADAELGLAATRAKDLRDRIEVLKRAIRQHQRPADELTREMASYLGHSELRFEVQPTGYTITRAGHPALNLSEGERTAIAFMYFLKSLEDTGFNRRAGVVVVDDPVSSLDANSLYSAFGFMKARTQDVGQLFVLTHNFTFFRQVRGWLQHMPGQNKNDQSARPARFYMLSCRVGPLGREAQLEPLDPLLQKYQSEYQYLFERVFKAATRTSPADALSDSYGLPNMARRLLETFLAFRVPQCDGLEKQLECIDFDAGKKTRVLRFLHTESHFEQVGDPEHDLSLLSESQPILQNLMELMEQADPAHYAAMVSLTDDSAHTSREVLTP